MPDVTLSRRDEVANVMLCLREVPREPTFASALVLLVSGNGRDGDCETAERTALSRLLQKQGLRVLEAPKTPYSAILWLQRAILRAVRAFSTDARCEKRSP